MVSDFKKSDVSKLKLMSLKSLDVLKLNMKNLNYKEWFKMGCDCGYISIYLREHYSESMKQELFDGKFNEKI